MSISNGAGLTDVSQHFHSLGDRRRTELEIKVQLLPEMYKPAEVVHHHWLHFAFDAFRRLRRVFAENTARPIDRFCSIGTSSGLDAIGAWEALCPKSIVLTDIVESAVRTARQNVLRNCKGLAEKDVLDLVGSLTTPLFDQRIQVDVVYANLPTLPMDAEQGDISRSGATAASFYAKHKAEDVPMVARDQLLELYFTFLTRLARRLTQHGVTVCALGGRVPWSTIEDLFTECGFVANLLLFDLKPQEQAQECLPVYRAYETDDLKFKFYPYEEAYSAIREMQADEPDLSFAERLARRDKVDAELASLKINAKEALDLHNKGRMVGHLVYMIMGQPIREWNPGTGETTLKKA